MRRRKQKNTLTKILIITIVTVSIGILSFFLYITYQNIEINSQDYTVAKTQSTVNAQIVENVEEDSKNVADIIEDTTRKVVGISKLKNAGSSIFSKSQESELGLGTGFIVTENGYIVSNAHVTGEKYSKCYVTLENGMTYDGKV